jgi:hypothetical protein
MFTALLSNAPPPEFTITDIPDMPVLGVRVSDVAAATYGDVRVHLV